MRGALNLKRRSEAVETYGAQSNGAMLFAIGAILATVVLATTLSTRWLDWVVDMESSPVATPLLAPDIPADYITGVFWAVLLGVVVAAWGTMVKFRGPLLIAWISKAAIDLGPMLFYDFRYGVEPDGIFRVATFPEYSWNGFMPGLGTENVRGLAWLHIQFLSSSFTAARLTFSFLGLVAVFLTYRAATTCIGREDRRLFWAFAFVPSVLFWSSTLGKDPVTLFGIAAYVYGVLVWYRLGHVRGLVWAAAGTAVAALIRVWLAPLLLIPLTVFALMRATRRKQRLGFVVLGVAGLVAAPMVLRLQLDTDVVRTEDMLAKASRDSRSFTEGGSTLDTPELQTFGDLTRFAPLGVFTVLFRPLPGEVPNLWGFLAGFENVFLLILAGRAIARTQRVDLTDPLVVWAFLTVLAWSFTYSITAYQNLGTASRHKLEITPLFFGLLLYLGRRRAVQDSSLGAPTSMRRVTPASRVT